MSSATFQGYKCWNDQRIAEVINKEAISVDAADFMATHAPLSHIRYLRAPSEISSTSEDGLLDELLQRADSNLHAFVVIQGIPGTGKSHLIRWLERRYRAERPQDVVLVIERAQNSLLGTLRQLIDKLEFDDDAMRHQLAKLRGATENLSSRALADSILDNLRVATYERPPREGERFNSRIRRNIEHFLLDPLIRAWLLKPGGPIERVTRFLAVGSRAHDADDRPEFRAEDFALPVDLLRDVRDQGLEQASMLANALHTEEKLRVELARYLNLLLDFAIGRTTVLSADDLKHIFNELRRQLRRQGKSLALFIEDITAFTGVDTGLIDVLVTQHTGEGNRDFCRITSVVGITDYYYNDRFPDNMRDRVSHRLTLNREQQGSPESDLLSRPDSLVDLAARYLNAMRLSYEVLSEWLDAGGRPGDLPSACYSCRFREPCHSSFGAVSVGQKGDDPIALGLYPFNARALVTMYLQLDTTSSVRTPRSLLNNVLLYVLQSHGHKVESSAFPPPPRELGNDFTPPPLAKPIQQQIIDSQGGRSARRLESLVLFWGDRTVDVRGEGMSRTVGQLSKGVFDAFDIPFIGGGDVVSSVPPRVDPERPTPPPPPPSPATGTPYDADIAQWRTGGRLAQYEDLRRFLSNFIQSAIDWDMYDLPRGLVEERLRPPRLQIEGQTGQVKGDFYTFQRTAELAYVLQALAELNHLGGELDPSIVGGHLATLGAWLRRVEPQIVEVARRPASTVPAPMPLVEVLLAACLFIEWSSDSLKVTQESSRDLLLTVLAGSASEASDQHRSQQKWSDKIERSRSLHSKAWSDLLRTLTPARVRTCRLQLLQLLNCAQGTSSDVRYIDAATALDVIRNLKRQNWKLRSVDVVAEASAPQAWKDGTWVYQKYAELTQQIVLEERGFLASLLGQLDSLLRGSPPQTVLREVDETLKALSEHKRVTKLTEMPAGRRALDTHLQFLRTTVAEERHGETLIRMSAGTQAVEQAQAFKLYFEQFAKEAAALIEQLGRREEQLRTESNAAAMQERVAQQYRDLVQELHLSIGREAVETTL